MTVFDKHLKYISADNSFAVCLPVNVLEKMHHECEKSLPNETGGILIGNYSDDLKVAHITKMVGKSRNSVRHCSSFIREGKDYLPILNRFWEKNQYYLGEWHYHPLSSSIPSPVDIATMFQLSLDKYLCCPEPILIIIGGKKGAWNITISVFCNGERIILS